MITATQNINSGYKQAFCGNIFVSKDKTLTPYKKDMETAYAQNRTFVAFPHDTMVQMGTDGTEPAVKFQTYVNDFKGTPRLVESTIKTSELETKNVAFEMCHHVLKAIKQKSVLSRRI